MHCHLDLYPDPFGISGECKKRDLYILSVTTTPKAWVGTSRLANGCEKIRTALGLHPQLAHQRSHELELFDALLPEARYVGEIGLDGGKGFKDHWSTQLKVFRHLLSSVNKAGGRIMSIHSRASAGAVLNELKGVTGVPILHWFTGTMSELKRAIDIGCWFSVGPAMLKTKKGIGMVSMIPKNRVLTETDGPFVKYNGKPLVPWDIELAIKKLSINWAVSEYEARQQVLNNLKMLTSKS